MKKSQRQSAQAAENKTTPEPGEPHRFKSWLQSVPVTTTDYQSVPLTITLRLDDWFSICQASLINSKTIDEIVSYVVAQRIDLTEWFNWDYEMMDKNGPRENAQSTTKNGDEWVRLPRALRKRAEEAMDEANLDVPFEFVLAKTLEEELPYLRNDSEEADAMRHFWKEAQYEQA